ncbi:unnamed protein product [Didymodactylos carnosus]|uniref:Proline dehydrogenase n=1 Tax=Didymodactylos carnosus TaxID=1234261 RepID=A0A8S2FAY5_9BILA|nr:unnamed protein product [Didymodactylos carnosus]CAF4212243.1 unnamed protein product [Didymodactylos carnosus]
MQVRFGSPSIYKVSRRCQVILCQLSTSSLQKPAPLAPPPSSFPKLDTDFNSHRIAYRYRGLGELLRGWFVYRLFSINILVNNQDKLAEFGKRILGRKLFGTIFQLTAFGHFVGGESTKDIQPIIKNLEKYRVKAILDYSIESDEKKTPPTESSATSSSDSIQYHTDHNEELSFDQNSSKFIECINISHNVCGINNLIAIKITALVQPTTLKKFSFLLDKLKYHPSSRNESLFQYINDTKQRSKDEINSKTSSVIEPLDKILIDNNNKTMSETSVLSTSELNELKNLIIRLNEIAQAGVKQKISIMVDAEQTYFQTAINFLATEMQRYFNKISPIVHGTYQCYLKDTLKVITTDLELAKKEDYIFAAKLVRGAYMEQERRKAREEAYEDPTNPTFDATTSMYYECLNKVLESSSERTAGRVKVMIASHNEDTIRYALGKMKDMNIPPNGQLMSFASLYENRGVFIKARKDRIMHLKAFQDRLFGSKQ